MRGNIKSFEKAFKHAEVVALAERTLKRFKGDRNAAGRYARSMEDRYESAKWARVVEVLATGAHAHAVKKTKSPAQLQREIDEALRASDREKHGYDTDPISDREFEQSARLDAKKYGLTHEEALQFVKHPSYLSIRSEIERWREQHGFPATNSSLTRGYLLDKLRVR